MTAISLRRSYFLVVFCFGICFLGCKESKIQVYRIPKEKEDTSVGGAPMNLPSGHPALSVDQMNGLSQGQGEEAGQGSSADHVREADLHWKVPSGWQEQSASGMRLASFQAPGAGGFTDVSVVVLPGAAGGVLANINRWRGQVGLDPMDEKSAGSQIKHVKTKAGELSLVDFLGTDPKQGNTRVQIVAAILFDGERTWFFKTQGEPSAVIAAKPSFLEFLGSLHFAK